MLTPSPQESSHLGLSTFRSGTGTFDSGAMFAEMLAQGADLVILRVPAGQTCGVRALAQFGVEVIHADTLVTYTCPLHELSSIDAVVPDGIKFDPARAADRDAIAALITRVFGAYPNHYAANPLLDPKAVLAGYAEWALSYIDRPDRTMWVARENNRIAAIACSEFNAAAGDCRGVLHAVDPAFARRGVYTAMIHRTQQYFRDRGCNRLVIATQAWNAAVQRVWVRNGFTLAGVSETFHVNALLDPRRGTARSVRLTLVDPDAEAQAARVLASMQSSDRPTPADARWQCACTLFGTLGGDGNCLLRVRTYAFAGASIGEVRVGMLYGSDERLCAIARCTLRSKP